MTLFVDTNVLIAATVGELNAVLPRATFSMQTTSSRRHCST
jgi:hypothetical protein